VREAASRARGGGEARRSEERRARWRRRRRARGGGGAVAVRVESDGGEAAAWFIGSARGMQGPIQLTTITFDFF
jgi:hypothetical protein